MHNHTDTAETASAEQQVWNVVEDFNHAFAANDTEWYFSFIDDEITVITPTNPRQFGIRLKRSELADPETVMVSWVGDDGQQGRPVDGPRS